jgi:hypothetical protein
MFVTRVGHFGEYGGPPDASWAVFFLAGLWLRMPRLFPAFFALGWVADLAAFALGTPNLCYSPAYLFLIPAYGALWMAGHWVARRADGQGELPRAGGRPGDRELHGAVEGPGVRRERPVAQPCDDRIV